MQARQRFECYFVVNLLTCHASFSKKQKKENIDAWGVITPALKNTNIAMAKKKNKKLAFQKRQQKKAIKAKHRAKEKAFEMLVKKTIEEYNKVHYRKLPGLPGMYPYQRSPIGRNEAIQLIRTGHFIRNSSTMNVSKGGEKTMNLLEELKALVAKAEAELASAVEAEAPKVEEAVAEATESAEAAVAPAVEAAEAQASEAGAETPAEQPSAEAPAEGAPTA